MQSYSAYQSAHLYHPLWFEKSFWGYNYEMGSTCYFRYVSGKLQIISRIIEIGTVFHFYRRKNLVNRSPYYANFRQVKKNRQKISVPIETFLIATIRRV